MQTKAEFYNYIDDKYHKKSGTYTLDELYEIGSVHKTLPKNQKNWQELADYVGYPGTAEHYRLATLRNSKDLISPLRIQDEEAILNATDEYESSYKQKTQIRDIYNSYRASLRNTARDEAFKELLHDAVKSIEPYKFNKYYTNDVKATDTEAVLMLSDLHIGVSCDNFYNKFNSKIAKRRLEKLLDDTLDYCKRFNVTQLNVCNLGDLIHGNIHTTLRIEAEKDVVDQIKTAAELIAVFLMELANRSNMRIIYRSCTDNHSRMTQIAGDNIESENLSRLIDWYLEPRLQLSKAPIIFANDNIDISIGKFDLLNKKKIMFAHGHSDNVNKCVDNFIAATHEYIDYVLLAHYHNAKEKSYGSSKVFVNGSIVGTEQYAFGKRLFGIAEQKLLIFDKDNVIDLSINVQNIK